MDLDSPRLKSSIYHSMNCVWVASETGEQLFDTPTQSWLDLADEHKTEHKFVNF